MLLFYISPFFCECLNSVFLDIAMMLFTETSTTLLLYTQHAVIYGIVKKPYHSSKKTDSYITGRLYVMILKSCDLGMLTLKIKVFDRYFVLSF